MQPRAWVTLAFQTDPVAAPQQVRQRLVTLAERRADVEELLDLKNQAFIGPRVQPLRAEAALTRAPEKQ